MTLIKTPCSSLEDNLHYRFPILVKFVSLSFKMYRCFDLDDIQRVYDTNARIIQSRRQESQPKKLQFLKQFIIKSPSKEVFCT